jgi:hypothetical protein
MAISPISPKSPAQTLSHYDRAATKIQAIFRGYLCRQQFMRPHDLPHLRLLCDDAHLLEFFDFQITDEVFDRAPKGKTPVYLPQNRQDIVIKLCKKEEAIKRYHLSYEVRKVVKKLGLNTLIIPRSRLILGSQGPCLIEERLSPISSFRKKNAKLYFDNIEAFTQLAKECARLFCVMPIRGLTNRKRDHTSGKIIRQWIRFDNFPLLLDEKGRGGLIDLERIRPFKREHDLKDLFRLFPFHEKEIFEEIRQARIALLDVVVLDFSKTAKIWKEAYRDGSGIIETR